MKTCCFIGHREIVETEELNERLNKIIENLIQKEKVDIFLFGSKSDFNSLCYETVSDLKEKHPQIKRVFVRGEYPEINDDYLAKAFKPEPAYKGGFKASFGSLSHISDSFMCFASPKSTHKTAPFRSQNFVIKGFLDGARHKTQQILTDLRVF